MSNTKLLLSSVLLATTTTIFAAEAPKKYIVIYNSTPQEASEYAVQSTPAMRIQAEKEVASTTSALTKKYKGRVVKKLSNSVHGSVIEMTPENAELMKDDPKVQSVEENKKFKINTTQGNFQWNLDRIDQRTIPLNNAYTYNATGAGVNVYVLDTGIRTTHREFGGRAHWSTNTVDTIDRDCNGHGTHVAGIVGGNTVGVAKGVELYAVKVVDCLGDGETYTIINGIDWVTKNAKLPAVINMSLSGSYSPAINAAVTAATNAGIIVVVAAGNDSAGVSSFSPASAPEAITVEATDRPNYRTGIENRADYSNAGGDIAS